MSRKSPNVVSWPAVFQGSLVTLALGAAIVLGSRKLRDFDSALVGYTFGCLFATFGLAYRYAVWLSKPPTQLYWRKGFSLLFLPGSWPWMARPWALLSAIRTRLVTHDFIWKRGSARWLAHFLIAWGCVLAAAVTFPLVFGWLHFEQAQGSAVPAYRVVAFGLALVELPLDGLMAWGMMHALVISAFLVTPGVMLAMWRRMRGGDALAVQRFGRDLLPLILLYAVSVTGLALWVSYEFLHGFNYAALAWLHAVTVIGTLLYLPFGKLFHIFQRPMSLGVALYRNAAARGPQATCPVTNAEFASKMQVDDLSKILGEVGFDYRSSQPDKPAWNHLSPQGKRRAIARAHTKARHNRFS